MKDYFGPKHPLALAKVLITRALMFPFSVLGWLLNHGLIVAQFVFLAMMLYYSHIANEPIKAVLFGLAAGFTWFVGVLLAVYDKLNRIDKKLTDNDEGI